jgi:hypothetical protein
MFDHPAKLIVPAALLLALPATLGLGGCSGDSGSSAVPSAAGARWHVDAGAPADGDGSSWARAARDLAAVLAKVRAGDQVWVAGGTYRPAARGGPRDARFTLSAHVAVFGGFAGGETALAQRDPIAHVTILDGDLAGDDGPDFANRADNVYQVVEATDAHGALLDGLTIRGGYADGPGFGPTPDSREQGSAINIYHGSIAVRGCTLRENWAANHGTVNDHSEGSTFASCVFVENASAQFGAGLYLHHPAASHVMDCTFERNVAVLEGGGAYVRAHHGAHFEDCTFTGNQADRGAGLYAAMESSPHVVRCSFVENIAMTGGGGQYSDEAFTTLEACEFTRNEAGTKIDGGGGGGGGSGGGGAWANGGAVVVIDCGFFENRASFGGGFYAIHDAAAIVTGCTFVANTANEAGGLYTLNSPVLVVDSTFTANVAIEGPFSVGGGLSNYYSDSIIERCVFTRNTASLGGGGLYNEGEHPVVRASQFLGNSTTGQEGFGGGILGGFFSVSTIEDCSFVGNRARQGGGTYDIAFSEARIVNCTYVANSAEAGGGIFVGNLALSRYANCIVGANSPDALGGFPADFVYGLTATSQPGDGNVAGVPIFAREPDAGPDRVWGTEDDDYGDLALLAGSPGIDAGANDEHSRASVLDLVGMPRFVDDPATPDSGQGDSPLVDIGARERQP